MEILKVSNKIGVIAEAQSDVDVLNSIILKYIDQSSFKIRKFNAGGAGKIKKKCPGWAKMLLARGCEHLIVIQDLDEKSEISLMRDLRKIVSKTGFKNHIVVIPVQEIEAWLLSDSTAS